MMRRTLPPSTVGLTIMALLAASPVVGQQYAGTPGSPGATTTIDGRYLPPPPPQFGGEISPNAAQSTPYWPALGANWLATFKEFPPRQKPASFSLDQVMQKIQEGATGFN